MCRCSTLYNLFRKLLPKGRTEVEGLKEMQRQLRPGEGKLLLSSEDVVEEINRLYKNHLTNPLRHDIANGVDSRTLFTSKRAAARIEKEVGDSQVYVSQVQLAEVADWATKHRAPAAERLEAIEQIAHMVPLTKEVCLAAAIIKSAKRKAGAPHFGIIDGIVLATARSLGQNLISFDNDFEGEDDCLVLHWTVLLAPAD